MTKSSKIAFRMDDITPGMNLEKFNRVRKIFDEFEVKPLLGLVPDNKDEKLNVAPCYEGFWDMIIDLDAAGWTMSQHGYIHIYDSNDGGLLKLRPKSEFAGHSFEVQMKKLSLGLEVLETKGIVPKVFMAPGHTFDSCTLKALKKLGFEYITDGLSDETYVYDEMIFVPSKNSRPKLRKGIDTICLHANEMTDEDFEELRAFIRNHRENVVDFSELMSEACVTNYGIKIRLQVTKNQMLSTIKKYVARNRLLHGILAIRSR